MLALVGNLIHPFARLSVDIGQIVKGTQRPEVLAHISDGSFDLAFLPCGRDVTGARNESVVAGEGKKARIEAHQVAFMFGDRGRKIIEPEFTRTALESIEGMDVAAHER